MVHFPSENTHRATDDLSDHPLTDLKPGDLLTVVLPPVAGEGWAARNQPPLGAVVVSDGLSLTGRILLRDYEPDFGWHPSRFVRTTAAAELLEEITTLLSKEWRHASQAQDGYERSECTQDPLDILIDDAFEKMGQQPADERLTPETDANCPDNGGSTQGNSNDA